MRTWRSLAAPGLPALGAWLLAAAVGWALTFPELTGRVVDQAGVLSPAAVGTLDAKLADLEVRSGIQLVVATVGTLEGNEIEPYANQLFRSWQLGQADKDNGVLLLVAPNERRVRIEVGYGLEGTLTDALSKVIITNAIVPWFQRGDFTEGVTRGVDDIITVLTTDSSEWEARPDLRLDRGTGDAPPDWLPIALMVAFFVLFSISPAFRRFVANLLMASMVSAGSGGGGYYRGGRSGGGSWGGGGGFSGGGGSSGGGGASGRW
jgi:uncharacterized protein